MLSFKNSRSSGRKLSLFLLVFCFITSIHPQQFSRLNGLEDGQGSTILLYSFGNDKDGRYAPVYKYFVDSGIETKIIDAYSQQIDTFNFNVKSVQDYEFFPNDINNFINVGLTLNIDVLGYAARNDSTTFTDWAFFFVDISNQHPNEVYISDFYKVYRSFDAGYTYPSDSIIDFQFLSAADFDDQIFFGTDNNRLIKSEDKGITSSIVDTSDFETSMPGLAFYYDVNQFHIYRLNRSNGKFTLNVSNNKGEAFSWTKTYESDIQFFITIDSTQSGIVYLAEGKQIYKSINNGYNFYPYKSLPRNLVGLYKKPNSEILYAASQYQLYEIKPDTTIIIKSVPIPEIELAYYPLSIGNKWIYLETIADFNGIPYTYSYEFNVREVLKDTLLANGYKYFKIFDQTTMNNHNIFYERIDSSNGLVYRYNDQFTTGNDEYLIDDLLAEVGDTILSSRSIIPYSYIPNVYCLDQGIYNNFGLQRSKKSFRTEFLSSYSYGLIRSIGLDSIFYAWDFGYSRSILKGCIIDGIILGDTTLTDVEEEQSPFPAEYKLEQNYPNPFNPSTKISWQSPVGSWQSIKLYNAIGQEIDTIMEGYYEAGTHTKLYIVNSKLPSGVYFYQLKAGDFVETKKMILLR